MLIRMLLSILKEKEILLVGPLIQDLDGRKKSTCRRLSFSYNRGMYNKRLVLS